MKAMILAAGYGTRLNPITDYTPKALVTIKGVSLLEILIRKMKKAGISDIIINVHYLADQIIDFVKSKNYFGIHIEFSVEDELLDTGGGLKKAFRFFDDNNSFLLHNVDILSDIDFIDFQKFHQENDELVSLAVNKRKANRVFLFNSNHELCGWKNHQSKEEIITRPGNDLNELGFSGVHMIKPEIFSYFQKDKIFSLTPFYLELSKNKNIISYVHSCKNWYDVGTIETLNYLERNHTI